MIVLYGDTPFIRAETLEAMIAARAAHDVVVLGFDTPDVAARREALLAAGVEVGPLLDGGGYVFANLKDPSGNSVQISGRAFRG